MELSSEEIQRQLSSKLHNHPRILLDGSRMFHLPFICISSLDEIHTMIKVLVDLHDKNISLSTLESSNVVRDREGKLMFRGLVFINYSPKSRKNDFMLLARLIQDSLWLPNEDEMFGKDLIQLMRDYSDENSDRDLLLNHVAFISLKDRLSFVRKIYEDRQYLSEADKQKYDRLLRYMDGARSLEDWRRQMRESLDKGLKCVKKCFEFNPKPRPVNYQDDTRGKFQFGRNLATHLPQYLREDRVSEDKILSETCRIIFKLFGKDYFTFQKLAHKEGILKHFMPGYTSSTPTTQTQTQTQTQGYDYSRSDVGGGGGGGGGGQGTHQYRTQGRSRVVAEPNGYIKGG